MKTIFKNKKDNKFFPTNKQIRAKEVIFIDHDNINHGLTSTFNALSVAKSVGLDLVQVNGGKTPTCKILDYGKFKFDQSKKEKLQRKKQRESITKLKEIVFRPSTGENDLRIKARKTQQFLEDGYKVKISIKMRGRELSNRSIAYDTLRIFLDMVPEMEAESPQMGMSRAGRCLTTIGTRKV